MSSSIGPYEVERWVRGYGREVCLATRSHGLGEQQRLLVMFDVEDERAQQLAREVEHGQALEHPHLARIERLFDHDSWRVVVLEYLPGTSLRMLIEHALRGDGEIGRVAAYHVGACLFSALAAAHTSRDPTGAVVPLIHGNLGPDQLLLGWNGSVKLIGFGLATMYQLSAVLDQQPSAAVRYHPPEYRNGGALTVRGNVFSAAAMMWTLLAGRPFQGNDLPAPPLDEFRSDIAEPVVDGLATALASSLLDRRATAAELARVFERAAAALGVPGEAALAGHLESLRLSVVDDELLAPAEALPMARLSTVPLSSLPPILSLPPGSDRFRVLSELPPQAELPAELGAFVVGSLYHPTIDITDESIPTIPAPPLRDDD